MRWREKTNGWSADKDKSSDRDRGTIGSNIYRGKDEISERDRGKYKGWSKIRYGMKKRKRKIPLTER